MCSGGAILRIFKKKGAKHYQKVLKINAVCRDEIIILCKDIIKFTDLYIR